jgi:hypothetical protein
VPKLKITREYCTALINCPVVSPEQVERLAAAIIELIDKVEDQDRRLADVMEALGEVG